MTRIWRAEDCHGNGIYSNLYDYMGEAGYYHSVKAHPLPDLKLKRFLRTIKEHRFGFGSLKQARQWLYQDKANKKLKKLGIFLSEYEIPEEDVVVSKAQAVFRPERAVLISRVPLDKINNIPSVKPLDPPSRIAESA